jgi:hypothetical protein
MDLKEIGWRTRAGFLWFEIIANEHEDDLLKKIPRIS